MPSPFLSVPFEICDSSLQGRVHRGQFLDCVDKNRDKCLAVVTKLIRVLSVDDDAIATLQGQNVLSQEAIAQRAIWNIAVPLFLKVECFRFKLIDEV